MVSNTNWNYQHETQLCLVCVYAALCAWTHDAGYAPIFGAGLPRALCAG